MKCYLCEKNYFPTLSIKELLFGKREEYLCTNCEQQFERISEKHCEICMKKSTRKCCEDCYNWQKYYPEIRLTHTALFYYNDPMREYFDRYKFMGDFRLRVLFTEQLKKQWAEKENIVVVPIPLSKERQMSRGYNQVEEILKAVGINYCQALEKLEETAPQSHKTREERLKVEQPFQLISGARSKLAGKNILIVDDIYTTGRTIYHAAVCVKKAEPKAIASFSIAR